MENRRVLEVFLNCKVAFEDKTSKEIAYLALCNAINDVKEEMNIITCTHDNTEFKHIRCDICVDCGEIVEMDV